LRIPRRAARGVGGLHHPPFNEADATIDPKKYRDLNALYRNCKSVGGSPTREVIPIPGPPS
jgi:hypothetical protein